MNLKTTLRAYAKVSPSILSNYVTRDELDNYVTHSELEVILRQFVREGENLDPAVIYGRKNGEWVPVLSVPDEMTNVLCYGMLPDNDFIDSAELVQLNRLGIENGCYEYLIEYEPTKNGYFWFCSTAEIKEITADMGLEYKQPVLQQPDKVDVLMGGDKLSFYCYRTNKLVALPGVTCRFKVRLK